MMGPWSAIIACVLLASCPGILCFVATPRRTTSTFRQWWKNRLESDTMMMTMMMMAVVPRGDECNEEEEDSLLFSLQASSSSSLSSSLFLPQQHKQQQHKQRQGMRTTKMSEPRRDRDLGGYDPSERIGEGVKVGDPQIRVQEKERSVTSILKELSAIQQQGPQKYCILGTRHCSYMHQQIIELLAYALVLSGNHVYTSGAGGTHAATIRGALRAERQDLLTVVLPQSMGKQHKESQELLERVDDVIAMPQNDEMSLDIASRICNSYLLSRTDQLISFAFHDSTTVIEASKEAKKLEMLVTVLYLD